jgi:nitrite reductase (NADH) small subunit
MSDFVRICARGELPADGQAAEMTVGDRVICIANVNGTVSAIDNVCLHRGGPLGQGVIEGGKIVCPWHGWQWNPTTGEAAHSPMVKVAVYPLKIEGEDVLVKLD